MSYIPLKNDVLTINVSGSQQQIYCNDILLATLTECNTMGACNQLSEGIGYKLFREHKKLN